MHINYFAPHFKHLKFHPNDKDTETFDSIKKLAKENGSSNIVDPVQVGLTKPEAWSNLGKAKSFAAFFVSIYFKLRLFL